MLGRALFVFVWLIIAAGVLLPMYPPDMETASLPVADSVLRATGSAGAACQDCPVADEGAADCRSDCPCTHLLPAAFVSFEDSFSPSVVLFIHPPSALPSELRPLLPKLPAI